MMRLDRQVIKEGIDHLFIVGAVVTLLLGKQGRIQTWYTKITLTVCMNRQAKLGFKITS